VDVFQGQFDFVNFSTQIHDFNPGFGPAVSPVGGNGFGTRVFWTVAIPEDDVEVNLAAGKAEMRVHNLALRDYGIIPVALGPNFQTAFIPATVSFDVVWDRPVTRRLHVRDGTNVDRFAGDFVENRATVTWSGSNAAGFRFHSNPGNFATSVDAFAELGHVRNGTFFEEDDDDSGSSGSQGGGANGGASRDQPFAALVLEGDNRGIPPSSAALALGGTDLALRDYQNDPGNGEGPLLPARDLTNGAAGDSAENMAAVVRAARDRAFELVSDPEATNLATEIGLPGGDVRLG
jgi:hypothetical protein